MNKKGEGEIFVLIIGVVLVFSFFSAIGNSNPYNTYMKDCKDLNKEMFPDEEAINLSMPKFMSYDFDELKRFCQDKWDGKKLNDVNVSGEEQDEV